MKAVILIFLFVGGKCLLEEEHGLLDEFDNSFYEALEKKRPKTMEGDIAIDNGDSGSRRSVLGNDTYMWPDAKVAIKFSSSFSYSERTLLRDAINEIQEKTCIKFHFKSPDDADFIVFAKPPDSGRCSSHVGRKGGNQEIFLGGQCLKRRTILHEILHALGFIHEHNRSDRDEYVTVNYDNIHPQIKGNFIKREKEELDEEIMKTGYAYESIMHYQGWQGAMNHNISVFTAKNKFPMLGGGNGLSDIDVERLNLRYKCPGRTTHEQTTETPIDYPQPAPVQQTKAPVPTTPPSTVAPPKLKWITENDITWSNHCIFKTRETTDVHNTTTKEQCGPFCKGYGNCDHFTWVSTVGNIGLCSLMARYKASTRPQPTADDVACGIISNKVKTLTVTTTTTTTTTTTPEPEEPEETEEPLDFNWMNDNGVTWSKYCDLGKSTVYINKTKEDCGPFCKGYGNCDHFTWIGTSSEGIGKCWLMAGYKTGEQATLRDYNYACGIIPSKIDRTTPKPTPPPRPYINPVEYDLDPSFDCERDGNTVNCDRVTYGDGMRTTEQCQVQLGGDGSRSTRCSSSSTSE